MGALALAIPFDVHIVFIIFYIHIHRAIIVTLALRIVVIAPVFTVVMVVYIVINTVIVDMAVIVFVAVAAIGRSVIPPYRFTMSL